MTLAGLLLVATMALPLALAATLGKPWARRRALDLLALAPLPGLVAALFVPDGSAALSPAPMRIVLALDPAGAALLAGASALWLLAGIYARTYLANDSRAARFAFWWLLTEAGSLGCFLVADVASFYLTFSLASLSAYWLVAHDRTPRATRAAFIYMALAVFGEAVLLLAFVMMSVGSDGNPLIADVARGLAASPHAGAIIALLVVGFGLKMGLVPLHVWMPLAHPVAPMPASAVLSGIIVKAGVIGLLRFLPLGQDLSAAGMALTMIGLATAFYAVAVGVTQTHPKTVLAYSTISQMGFVATIVGAGLAAGSPSVASIAAFYALHHLLVKGALFLGVGIATTSRSRTLVLLVMAALGLALAGLPLTSGALAKYAAKDVMGDGAVKLFASLAATGSTLLMLHFVRVLARQPADHDPAPLGLVLPWAVAAIASLVAPWVVMPMTGMSPLATLAPAALWASIWPMLVGAALFAALLRFGARLPTVPEGDIVVLAYVARPRLARAGAAIDRADAVLRTWPAGALALLVVGLAVAATLARFGP